MLLKKLIEHLFTILSRKGHVIKRFSILEISEKPQLYDFFNVIYKCYSEIGKLEKLRFPEIVAQEKS